MMTSINKSYVLSTVGTGPASNVEVFLSVFMTTIGTDLARWEPAIYQNQLATFQI